MGIRFSAIFHLKLGSLTDTGKYYAVAKSSGSINKDGCAERISKSIHFSPPSWYAAFIDLFDSKNSSIKVGNILKIENFGSFRVNLGRKDAPTAELLSIKHIKAFNMSFHSAKSLKENVLSVADLGRYRSSGNLLKWGK